MWTVHWKHKEEGIRGWMSSPFTTKERAEREAQNPPRDFLEVDYIEEHA